MTSHQMTATVRSSLAGEAGVFSAHDLDAMVRFFDEHGFATLRGLLTEEVLASLDEDMTKQQALLIAGELPERCGTVILDDPDAEIEGAPFAHYVCHLTEVSAVADEAVRHAALVDAMYRLLGPDAWLLDDDRFGVVYQDARPGPGSAYSRIGWHSDFQSGPHLNMWPSVAFTIHLDATSPQNGFLRVLPGSHRGGDADMPAGFEKVAGELAVYCERGDILLHHSALWHSAARATDDGQGAVRRHIRGGWYGGERLKPGHGLDDFVKNARR
jgi:ectoine hydroxylase-related dioxygenase (phytanoyl-CoA dioxygenase family)